MFVCVKQPRVARQIAQLSTSIESKLLGGLIGTLPAASALSPGTF